MSAAASFQAILSVRPATTITFQTSSLSTTSTSTPSYASLSIGTAAGNRYVLVALYSLSLATNSISAVTIGGVSATLVGTTAEGSGGGSFARVAFYIALVPTGTTATVAVTYGGNAFRHGCAVYTLQNLNSTTAFANTTSTTSTGSGSINVPAGGVAVAADIGWISGSTTSFTWTGVTEDFDLPNSQDTFSGGSLASSAGASPLSITATPAAGCTASSGAYISLR